MSNALRNIFKDHKKFETESKQCISNLKTENEILEAKLIEINKEIAETRAIVDKLKCCNNCKHDKFCLEDIKSKKIDCVTKDYRMWEIWELKE